MPMDTNPPPSARQLWPTTLPDFSTPQGQEPVLPCFTLLLREIEAARSTQEALQRLRCRQRFGVGNAVEVDLFASQC